MTKVGFEAQKVFYLTGKGGVARTKGDEEKEQECTTECKTRQRDEMTPWALNYESGEGRSERRGVGEDARSVRGMCDVCAVHADRAAVGLDIGAQGSSLREDETHFSPW